MSNFYFNTASPPSTRSEYEVEHAWLGCRYLHDQDPAEHDPQYTLYSFEKSYTAAQQCRLPVRSLQPKRHQLVAKTTKSTLDWTLNTVIAKSLPNTIHVTLCIVLRSPIPPRSNTDYPFVYYNKNDINTRKNGAEHAWLGPQHLHSQFPVKNDQCYILDQFEKSSTVMRGHNEQYLLQHNQTDINT